MRIGVRLGETRAHGVLVHAGSVLAAASVPRPLEGTRVVRTLLRDLAATAPSTVDSVTWDVSAVFESTLARASSSETDDVKAPRAQPVAVIRVLPKPPHAPGHPSKLVRTLVAWRGTVTGGHDLFGTELAAVDLDTAGRHAAAARAKGLTTLAITATGASGCTAHEEIVAARLLEQFPDLRLCLSHEVGGLGLLEREAATVVNAALLGVAEDLVARCERVTGTLDGPVSCWFATGDGGRVSAKRLHSLPVLGLAATAAAALLGASTLSGSTDALVVLTGPETIAIGQVRDGLPHVESDLPGTIGVRMAAPQPALTVSPAETVSTAAALLSERGPSTTGVVAVLDEGGYDVADQLLLGTRHTPILVRADADIAAVGSACAEPSAWLDLVISAGTREELHRLQSLAEQRALTLVAASGAPPGSERIVRSVAMSLGFLRSDLYRLHVRASSYPGWAGAS